MASYEHDENEQEERVISLPHLQNLLKRDPEAYEAEFLRQYEHFLSTLEIFQLKPQKANKHFHELVMFLAHVTPCYKKHHQDYPEQLIKVLQEFHNVIHPGTRKTLVQALVLLRNRGQFDLVKVLPMYFKMFKCPDKLLRKSLLTHVVKDIERTWKLTTSLAVHGPLQTFFYSQLKGSDFEILKKAIAVLICLAQKKIWNSERTVNQISSCLLCPDLKAAAGAAHFFLGNKVAIQKEVMSDSEDEDSDEAEAKEIIRKNKVLGQKKTKGKTKKLERAKKISKRLLARKDTQRAAGEGNANYAAIDALHDPHALVERLMGRIQKSGEPFSLRLLLTQLVSRIISRHHMIILNYFPFLMKYMHPNQKQVTQILACAAQATHELVPPEELAKVVTHVMNTFVSEASTSEVIAVGMNCIREICYKSPFALTEDQLADLTGFKKYKDKSVMMATKALINVYREKNPEMLNRSLRGKEAQVGIIAGENVAPVYGKARDENTTLDVGIDGLDILVAAKRLKKRSMDQDLDESDFEDVVIDHEGGSDDEESSVDLDASEPEVSDEEAGSGEEEEVEEASDAEEQEEGDEKEDEENEEGESEAAKPAGSFEDEKKARVTEAQRMLMEQVLSTDDFKKIKKLKLKRSIEAQLGRKRTRDEAWLYDQTDDEDDSDKEKEDSGDDDIITPDRLKTFIKDKRKGKEARMQSVMKGREERMDIKEKRDEKKKRKGGKTNKEQRRNKPTVMVLEKKRRSKNDANDRINTLKRTIKKLGNAPKSFNGKLENRGGKKNAKKMRRRS